MKILVRLPTWLGDAVMATPMLEILHSMYTGAQFTYIGSSVSCALFERDSRVARLLVDDSKKARFRLRAIALLGARAGEHDIAITLQNNFLSALTLAMSRSKIRIGFAKEYRSLLLTHAPKYPKNLHQVERYARLLEPLLLDSLHENLTQKIGKNSHKFLLDSLPPLKISYKKAAPLFTDKVVIGVNPGAAFGSAKRWCEEHFCTLIDELLARGFGVVIFGGEGEREGNARIVAGLKNRGLLIDLSAKTTLEELVDTIATLDLFITNDSGPMHIACALMVPMIALFGSTDMSETSPWRAQETSVLLSKNLPCAPCKKRICPLGHHNCMRLMSPNEVLNHALEIVEARIK